MVDEAHQVIVATALTNQAADSPHFSRMLVATLANVGAPARLLTDAGYWSDEPGSRTMAKVGGHR